MTYFLSNFVTLQIAFKHFHIMLHFPSLIALNYDCMCLFQLLTVELVSAISNFLASMLKKSKNIHFHKI